MTTNVQDLIRRVQAIAPLPLTVAEPQAGRAVIVGSNGRVLGWVATTSGDYKAVAELWTLAPTIVQALVKRNAELEAENARLRASIAFTPDADHPPTTYEAAMARYEGACCALNLALAELSAAVEARDE